MPQSTREKQSLSKGKLRFFFSSLLGVVFLSLILGAVTAAAIPRLTRLPLEFLFNSDSYHETHSYSYRPGSRSTVQTYYVMAEENGLARLPSILVFSIAVFSWTALLLGLYLGLFFLLRTLKWLGVPFPRNRLVDEDPEGAAALKGEGRRFLRHALAAEILILGTFFLLRGGYLGNLRPAEGSGAYPSAAYYEEHPAYHPGPENPGPSFSARDSSFGRLIETDEGGLLWFSFKIIDLYEGLDFLRNPGTPEKEALSWAVVNLESGEILVDNAWIALPEEADFSGTFDFRGKDTEVIPARDGLYYILSYKGSGLNPVFAADLSDGSGTALMPGAYMEKFDLPGPYASLNRHFGRNYQTEVSLSDGRIVYIDHRKFSYSDAVGSTPPDRRRLGYYIRFEGESRSHRRQAVLYESGRREGFPAGSYLSPERLLMDEEGVLLASLASMEKQSDLILDSLSPRGERLWTLPGARFDNPVRLYADDSIDLEARLLSGGRILVTASTVRGTSGFLCVDRRSGQVLWRYQIPLQE